MSDSLVMAVWFASTLVGALWMHDCGDDLERSQIMALVDRTGSVDSYVHEINGGIDRLEACMASFRAILGCGATQWCVFVLSAARRLLGAAHCWLLFSIHIVNISHSLSHI